MPAKIARSAPRPPFEVPKVMVAVRTSLLSCRKAGKNANIHASPGVIWRIPVKRCAAGCSRYWATNPGRQRQHQRRKDAAFAAFVREQVDALFIGPGGFCSSRRVHIANQAMRHGIPATYSQREYPEIGGLMSYGTKLTDTWRQ